MKHFPHTCSRGTQGQVLKRGARSQKQAKVLVIVESKEVDKMLIDYWDKCPEAVAEKIKRLSEKPKANLSEKSYTT